MKGSDMKMPNGQFENSWKEAFYEVEMVPSSRVWNTIDGALSSQENGKFKRRFLVWQLVAAASILFAASTFVINFFGNNSNETNNELVLSSDKPLSNSDKSSNPTLDQSSENSEVKTPDKTEKNFDKNSKSSSKPKSATPILAENKQGNEVIEKGSVIDGNRSEILLNENTLSRIGTIDFGKIRFITPDVHKIYYYHPVEEEREKSSYPLWAGVKIAGGTSSSEKSSSGLSEALNSDFGNTQNVISTTSSPGYGYAFGVALGKNVGERVYVQSGLQYVSQTTRGTTNAYYQNSIGSEKEPLFIYNKDISSTRNNGTGAVLFTNPIEVSSSMEYLSVPIQVGYLLIDRKIDWGIAAGISGDIFLRNVLSDNSDELDRIVTRSGSESSFRSVNFSGLISTEINYNITENYSISLEPRYAVAFSPVTRKDANVEDRRLRSFTIGLKLRYLF